MRHGTAMPSFEGALLATKATPLGEGRPVIVFFWSISCAQCQEMFELVTYIAERYKNVDIISVHMPRTEQDMDLKAIKHKYKQQKWRMPLYIDEQLIISKRFHNRFVPSIYVFREDRLKFSQAGTQNNYFTKQRIEKVLGGASEK